MVNYLYYNPYGHGDGNSEPVGDECGNIIGLELEIASVAYDCYDGWNSAIEDGILETSDSASAYIQLEEEAQDNVEFELVFNADDPETIIERLDELNNYIYGTFNTASDNSCHIHLNRYYIQDVLNIPEIAFYRATEAVAPLIYAVSGRTLNKWNRWTPSQLPVVHVDYLKRLQTIDNIEPNTPYTYNNPNTEYNARYELCNVQNDETIELRGFSNWFENDSEIIALYIKIADELIPEIATLYGATGYWANPEPLFKAVNAFIDENSDAINKTGADVSGWRNYEDSLLEHKRALYTDAIDKYQAVQNNLNHARRVSGSNKLNALEYVTIALQHAPELTPSAINLDNILETINQLEIANQKLFKNTVWRI